LIFNNIKILPGYPAALYKNDILIMADFHLGFENEVAKEGVYVPRLQLKKAIGTIQSIIENFIRPYKFVINGDLKHTFEKLTVQEREEISKFLSVIKDYFDEILLVRGNHDNYVSIITDRFDVVLTEFFEPDEKTLLIHGHKYSLEQLENKELIVIGHEHPAFKVFDEMGSITKYPCFLHVPLTLKNKSVLVLPAAGYYQTGNPVTLDPTEYLSPLIKKHGIVEEAVPIIFEYGKDAFEFPPLKTVSELLVNEDLSNKI